MSKFKRFSLWLKMWNLTFKNFKSAILFYLTGELKYRVQMIEYQAKIAKLEKEIYPENLDG